jgi:hypothetical protein
MNAKLFLTRVKVENRWDICMYSLDILAAVNSAVTYVSRLALLVVWRGGRPVLRPQPRQSYLAVFERRRIAVSQMRLQVQGSQVGTR